MYKKNLKQKASLTGRIKSVMVFVLLTISTYATAAGKNISVRMPESQTTISEAFSTLQTQTGYKFSWDRSFDVDKTVMLPTSVQPFSQIMEILLRDSKRVYVFHESYVLIKDPAQTQQSNPAETIPIAPPRETVTTVVDTQEIRSVMPPDLNITTPQVVVKSEDSYSLPKFKAITTSSIIEGLQPTQRHRMPVFAIKTNLIHDAFAAINLGVEIRLSSRLTLDLPFSVNQWKGDRRTNIFLVQPELRWWIAEPFNGHFIGIHAHFAHFGIGNIDIPLDIWNQAKEFHFQGDLFGAGVSYGYQWILARRLNLEANIGLGYFRAEYDKFSCRECNTKVEPRATKHYFGPTKAGISLIYILK